MLALIIVLIISIIFVWYISRSFHISDDQFLDLSNSDNKVSNYNLTPNYLEPKLVAAKYFNLVHNLEVDPDDIIVGDDLEFNLRDTLGLELSFGLLPDHDQDLPDLSLLNTILDDPYHLAYLKEALRIRWEQLALLGYEPTNSSYLYLDHDCDKLITANGRVNLLCNNYEFDALITRLKTSRGLLTNI